MSKSVYRTWEPLSDAKDEDGLVVEAVLACLETGYVGKDGFGDLGGW